MNQAVNMTIRMLRMLGAKSKSKSKRQKRKHFEMCDLSGSENSDIASYVKPKSKGKKSKKRKSKESESESSCDESSADSSDSESSSSDHVKNLNARKRK